MFSAADRSIRAGLAASFIGLAVVLFAISLELSIMAETLQGVPILVSFIGPMLALAGGVELTLPRR